ncbi:hypothetical protein I6B53_10565 [Schaalia sp. 19OD2882]|nr:hypothetical protein I6B53_10565 [Schaalia sp. 19OD2882]
MTHRKIARRMAALACCAGMVVALVACSAPDAQSSSGAGDAPGSAPAAPADPGQSAGKGASNGTESPSNLPKAMALGEPVTTEQGTITITKITFVPAHEAQSAGDVALMPGWTVDYTWTNTTDSPQRDQCAPAGVYLSVMTSGGKLLGDETRKAILCEEVAPGATVKHSAYLDMTSEDRDPESATAFVEDAAAIALVSAADGNGRNTVFGLVTIPR